MKPPPASIAPQFPVLDTLRFIGALAVLTTHTTFQSGDYFRNGALGTFFARLDVGVAVFFVLSGFLLSRAWLARAAAGLARPETGRYFEKRFLRIVPVYVTTVLVALVFIPENSGLKVREWIATLLMTDPYLYKRQHHGLTHMWSLTVEVAFYILLPILMWLVLRKGLRPRRLLTLLACMVAVSVTWHLWFIDLLSERVAGVPGIWLPGFLTWFATGIALAWVHVRQGHQALGNWAWLPRLAQLPGVCWIIVAGLMLIAATPLLGPSMLAPATSFESLAKHLVYALIGGLVVASGIWAPLGSRFSRLMSSTWLRHLGRISYSVFAIHLTVLSLVMGVTDYELFEGHGLQIWALTVALTLIASEVLYRSVELPFLRLKRKVGSGADGRDVETATPTTIDATT